MIYLDNASSHILLKEVKENLNTYLENDYNPSAKYLSAEKVNYKINEIRKVLLEVLKIPSYKVIFTSGASEANSMAILGYYLKRESDFSVAYMKMEHSSVLKAFDFLKTKGIKLFKFNYNKLVNDIDSLISDLKVNNIKFIVLNHVYSSSGLLCDIGKVAQKIKDKIPNIYIHADISQSFMKSGFSVKHIDSVALSAHKIGGLKGSGALIIKDMQMISPIIFGGKQNFSLRGGTENLMGIFSLGDAVSVWVKNNEYKDILRDLNLYFREQFSIAYGKNENVRLITPFENSFYGIVTFAVKNILGEHIIRFLGENKIMISGPSNCHNLNYIPDFSNFMALDKSFYNGILRVSFSPYNTKKEINEFFNVLNEAIDFFS